MQILLWKMLQTGPSRLIRAFDIYFRTQDISGDFFTICNEHFDGFNSSYYLKKMSFQCFQQLGNNVNNAVVVRQGITLQGAKYGRTVYGCGQYGLQKRDRRGEVGCVRDVSK